jgi:hypothetical protein
MSGWEPLVRERSATIEYCGIAVTVTGQYCKGDDVFQDDLRITVGADDQDIQDLLSEYDREQIIIAAEQYIREMPRWEE